MTALGCAGHQSAHTVDRFDMCQQILGLTT
jgi:hypothetical protein